MKRHEITTHFDVSEKDFKLITDIVENYSGLSYASAVLMMLKIFMSDIKPVHYIVLGVLIGERSATIKAEQKQNNLFICQRLN